MKQEQSLFRATALLTAVGLVSQSLSFFYRAVLSRLVGAETLGLYQLIMPVYAVLQSVLMTGLGIALSSLSAGALAKNGQKAVTQLLHLALEAFFVLWIPIAVVVCLCSELLSGGVLGDERTQLGLVLLLPVLLLTGVENLHKHHFYGIGETRLPAAVELAEQVIRTAAILGLLWYFLPLSQDHAVAVIVIGMFISEVFSSVTLVLLRLRREGRMGKQSGGTEYSPILFRRLLGVAVPVSGAALLNNLVSSANAILIPQRLILFGLSEQEAVEQFGVVFGMTLPLLTLPTAFVNALCLALLPRLTRSHAGNRKKRLVEDSARALRAVSLLLFPMLAILLPMGRDLGQLMFQEKRVGGYLLPLAVLVALSSWDGVLGVILNGVGKQSLSALLHLLCGIIQLGLTYWGIPLWGFWGCFAGMLAADLLGILLRLWAARKAFGLRLRLYEWVTAPALAAVLSGAWARLAYTWLKHQGYSLPLCVFTVFLLGGLLYLLALAAQGVLKKPFTFCRSSCQSSTHRKRMT